MTSRAHIAIIGSGPIGLWAAKALSERGMHVHVFDKASGPGEGASRYNSGMIHPSQAYPWALDCLNALPDDDSLIELYSLAYRSMTLWKQGLSEWGRDVTSYSDGTYQLCQSGANYTRLGARYTMFAGLTDLTFERREMWGRRAFFFPNDFHINPYKALKALAAHLEKSGVSFTWAWDAFKAPSIINDFDHVVIAAGTGTKSLAKQFSFSDKNIPVTPIAGHALNFKKPQNVDFPKAPIMDAATRSSLTVFDDHIRLSGSVGLETPDALLALWQKNYPEIMSSLGEPHIKWTGYRPMSDIGVPIVSADHSRKFWLCAGHGHMGLTYAAGAGEQIADRLCNSVAA